MIERDKEVAKTFETVETLSNIANVFAEDGQEALLKAQDMYRNEDVVLYPDDFIDTKFNVFKYD